jgi:hypothetical protein
LRAMRDRKIQLDIDIDIDIDIDELRGRNRR